MENYFLKMNSYFLAPHREGFPKFRNLFDKSMRLFVKPRSGLSGIAIHYQGVVPQDGRCCFQNNIP